MEDSLENMRTTEVEYGLVNKALGIHIERTTKISCPLIWKTFFFC